MKVIDVITAEAGFDAASTICQIWGDQTLYIPDNPGPDHPIAQDIGYEPLLRIVAVYGGQTIHPPRLQKSHLANRAKARYLKSLNLSDRKISWVLDLTPNRVRQLLEGTDINDNHHEQRMERELMAEVKKQMTLV